MIVHIQEKLPLRELLIQCFKELITANRRRAVNWLDYNRRCRSRLNCLIVRNLNRFSINFYSTIRSGTIKLYSSRVRMLYGIGNTLL